TITFPPGSTIQPHGFFVVGGVNSGGPVDVNYSTCGCAFKNDNNGMGCYTNSNEQVVLFNPSGTIIDAVYWGGGQNVPTTITAPSVGSCGGITLNIPSVGSYPNLSSGGSDGCSQARECDGSSNWVSRCGAQTTMGTTNGPVPLAKFTV